VFAFADSLACLLRMRIFRTDPLSFLSWITLCHSGQQQQQQQQQLPMTMITAAAKAKASKQQLTRASGKKGFMGVQSTPLKLESILILFDHKLHSPYLSFYFPKILKYINYT